MIDPVSFYIGLSVAWAAVAAGYLVARIKLRHRSKAIDQCLVMAKWAQRGDLDRQVAMLALTRRGLDNYEAGDFAGVESAYLEARRIVDGVQT